MSFSVWCLSIITDGCASSNQSLGPMLIKVHCFSCLGLIWVLWMRWCCISSLHHVCVWHTMYVLCWVVFSLFSLFVMWWWRKGYHNHFITTPCTHLYPLIYFLQGIHSMTICRNGHSDHCVHLSSSFSWCRRLGMTIFLDSHLLKHQS